VTDGVARVRDAGASLNMIGSLVESLSEHIEAIAIASDEQALGLKEVNLAVNTLDGVTQRNALMMERTTPRAEHWRTKARRSAGSSRNLHWETMDPPPSGQRDVARQHPAQRVGCCVSRGKPEKWIKRLQTVDFDRSRAS